MQRILRIAFIRIIFAYAVATRIFLGYYFLARIRGFIGEERYHQRLDRAHLRSARRIMRAMTLLKGLFIKAGQGISAMGMLLPEAYSRILGDLQDKAPESSHHAINSVIESDFGIPPKVLFASFETQPVASASIAQVHRAQLKSGETVAVKVRHPHIERIARTDLRIIKDLTAIGSKLLKIEGIDHVYSQIAEMIGRELDFNSERQGQKELARLLQEEPGLEVPEVFDEYSSACVLTTAWCHGVKINNLDQLAEWGHDRTALARRIIQAYCTMVLNHGYYHADPHPGNILVTRIGGLVLLDFGATARVSRQLREGIPLMIEAAMADDTESLIRSGREIGFLTNSEESAAVVRQIVPAMRAFVLDELKLDSLNLRNIDFDPFDNSMTRLIREVGVRRLTRTFRVPKDWIMLNRTISLLAGLSSALDPEFNPLGVVREHVRNHMINDGTMAQKIALSLLRKKLQAARHTLNTVAFHVIQGMKSTAAAAISGISALGSLLIP